MQGELRAGLEPYPGYRLVQFLGRGGWGEVWKAERADKKVFAVKFLRSATATSTTPSFEIRALHGIRLLDHPNLLKIEQIWSCSGFLAICMELADGSLHDLLDVYYTELGSAMQPDHLCHFLTQAAEAIDFLNTRQHMVNEQRVAFRHCDIKPSNLLLVGSTVKVADFSLSFQTSASMGYHTRCGTLQYAAPEVFNGLVSEWSDQYALAVSYCHLRLGRLPYPPPPTGRFTSKFVRPEADLAGVPPKEKKVLLRALDHVPQSRWRNCRDFMDQLRKSMAPEKPHVSQPVESREVRFMF